jgi:hypothetical protein
LLIIKEIKTTMMSDLTSQDGCYEKRVTSVGEDVEKLELLHIAGGKCKKVQQF